MCLFSTMVFYFYFGSDLSLPVGTIVQAYLLPLLLTILCLCLPCNCLPKSAHANVLLLQFQVRYEFNNSKNAMVTFLLVPWIKNHLSSFELGFLNIFSHQNLLCNLPLIVFLLQRYKYGAKNVQKLRSTRLLR